MHSGGVQLEDHFRRLDHPWKASGSAVAIGRECGRLRAFVQKPVASPSGRTVASRKQHYRSIETLPEPTCKRPEARSGAQNTPWNVREGLAPCTQTPRKRPFGF